MKTIGLRVEQAPEKAEAPEKDAGKQGAEKAAKPAQKAEEKAK
jgi:hypothetical protein